MTIKLTHSGMPVVFLDEHGKKIDRPQVKAIWAYYLNDPLAVHLMFEAIDTHWVFALELLTKGVKHQCGIGDVQVRPLRRRHLVEVRLKSPSGDVRLGFRKADLKTFTKKLPASVPKPRTEAINAELDAIFNPPA